MLALSFWKINYILVSYKSLILSSRLGLGVKKKFDLIYFIEWRGLETIAKYPLTGWPLDKMQSNIFSSVEVRYGFEQSGHAAVMVEIHINEGT